MTLKVLIQKLFFIAVLCVYSPKLRAEGLRWRMVPGDQKSFSVEQGEQIKLSGKSIVEVERLKSGEYQVTALRAGLVYLRLFDSEGQLRKSWIIDVMTPLSAEKTELLFQEPWQKFFCEEPGIECDPTSTRVFGETASLSWFHRAKKQCEKLNPCRFEVRLSTAARQQWSRTLSDEWPGFVFEVLEDGFVRLLENCETQNKTEAEALQAELKERYGAPMLWKCKIREGGSLLLEFLATTQRSESSSLDNPLRWKLPTIPSPQALEAFLEGLSQEGSLQIIAKPRVLSSVGSEVHIRDGGELRTHNQGREGVEEQWKPIGFQLKSQILLQKEQKFQVRSELKLSRRQSSVTQLSSSELQTTLWIAADEWTEVGTIQTESEDHQNSAIPWLGDIPGLGRLFTWNQRDKQRHDLRLLMRISTVQKALPEATH